MAAVLVGIGFLLTSALIWVRRTRFAASALEYYNSLPDQLGGGWQFRPGPRAAELYTYAFVVFTAVAGIAWIVFGVASGGG